MKYSFWIQEHPNQKRSMISWPFGCSRCLHAVSVNICISTSVCSLSAGNSSPGRAWGVSKWGTVHLQDACGIRRKMGFFPPCGVIYPPGVQRWLIRVAVYILTIRERWKRACLILNVLLYFIFIWYGFYFHSFFFLFCHYSSLNLSV